MIKLFSVVISTLSSVDTALYAVFTTTNSWLLALFVNALGTVSSILLIIALTTLISELTAIYEPIVNNPFVFATSNFVFVPMT